MKNRQVKVSRYYLQFVFPYDELSIIFWGGQPEKWGVGGIN